MIFAKDRLHTTVYIFYYFPFIPIYNAFLKHRYIKLCSIRHVVDPLMMQSFLYLFDMIIVIFLFPSSEIDSFIFSKVKFI